MQFPDQSSFPTPDSLSKRLKEPLVPTLVYKIPEAFVYFMPRLRASDETCSKPISFKYSRWVGPCKKEFSRVNGLAQPMGQKTGEDEMIYGTPGYTAPEVC